MSKSTSFANAQLRHVLHGDAILGLSDNSSSPITTLTLALHSADPGAGGDQTTNEIAYGGYARITVARSSSGWTIAGTQASNAADALFPACTSGTATATHFSVGSGSGDEMYYSAALDEAFPISTGKVPKFRAGRLKITEA